MEGLYFFIAGFFEFVGIIISLPAIICNTISNYFYGLSGFNNNDETEND